ncbi:MAG: hypothetical protein ACD_62C00271G0005 [uncultured bacterium]|nr:MAG: hypothetical protein ACD_62C00271G0005 [uncultured bacterium]
MKPRKIPRKKPRWNPPSLKPPSPCPEPLGYARGELSEVIYSEPVEEVEGLRLSFVIHPFLFEITDDFWRGQVIDGEPLF